jgi:hypothetical protein
LEAPLVQPSTLHVFVSSTWSDLRAERRAVEAALQRLRETKFIGMEYFGSWDETTRQASLAEVDRCQVYVGLFGGRYGSGITEAEYHRARERRLPCFIYVKDDAVIPPDGRETNPEQVAQLDALKAKLRDPSAHIVSTFTTPDDLSARLTADLHRWLVDHYLTPRLEQAAQGMLPREETQTLLAAVKDLSVLNQELLARLRAAGYAMAQGERSIAVGHAIGSILVTGDYNRVFVGEYERLREAYIPPWSVFERVHLEHFAGREWLVREVDAFLQDHDRGYFVLEAGAGLGKTTFLAHLVRERGYIHHFVELAPGPDGIALGLKNLAAQLIRAWNLGIDRANESLPSAAARPDFLYNLLFEGARRRDASNPGERIVLVVDALNEAGTPSGQNVLGLPKVLPAGVYLIVSQQPVEVTLEVQEGPRRIFRLEAVDARNLADMHAYLEGASRWAGVARALAEAQVSAAQFVETLLAKCQGVWIYLHYVVREIERGERSPLLLDTLPQGVWQYYARYWTGWRRQHADTWNEIHLPMLGTVAAVQEDLPLGRLCTLAGVVERWDLHPLLEESWRPFLVISESKGSEGAEFHYRLYHASLRDFLDGRADLTGLTTQERARTSELANERVGLTPALPTAISAPGVG